MMYLGALWLGFAGILLVQLLFCFRQKKILLKLLPVLLLAVMFGISMAVFHIASGMGEAGRQVAFLWDWYSVLVCCWIVADVLAWLLFLIIKVAQKLSKLFVM